MLHAGRQISPVMNGPWQDHKPVQVDFRQVLELTYHARQVLYDFDLPNIIFGLPEINYYMC